MKGININIILKIPIHLIMSFIYLTIVNHALVWGEENYKTIVIDPGHGGNDKGAAASSQISESSIALNLANILADRLKDRYLIVFTRNSDYQIELNARASIANNNRADVFISLHTAAGFISSAEGINIFTLQDDASDNPSSLSFIQPSINDPLSWVELQKKNISQSSQIAAALSEKLKNLDNIKLNGVYSMPLTVLRGVMCPSLMIEIGCLNSPIELQKLKDSKFLGELCTAIAGAIDQNFEKKDLLDEKDLNP